MFTVDRLSKSYGEVEVLRDISCSIATEEIVFIMGPSGSGKSTFLRMLALIETPSSGEVSLLLMGEEFNSRAQSRPWPKLTAVFQRQFLWPHLTLRSNIELPLKVGGVADASQRVDRVIEQFQMSGFIDRFPNQVSGGQAQRAALARALVLEPQLILIDEAHGGLDLVQQKILNDYLITLQQSGIGLIVVSHSLEFARTYADSILIIDEGKIAEFGDKNLFDHPSSSFLKTVMKLK